MPPGRQSVAAILDGEPLMLNAAGHEFPGIYTRARTEPERGAAIILHGCGMHPEREQVAGPLRKTLPAHAQLVPLLVQINSLSAQRRIPGSDHYYSGRKAELSVVISDWLDSRFPLEKPAWRGCRV